MPATLLRQRGVDRPPPAPRRRLWWAITLAVVLLGFAARLTPMVSGAGLGSIGSYDDGVYYTAATALVHGRLPYRDFLLLHPPGILLVLAPFGWLGSHTSDATGFAVGRLAFMLVGGVNSALVLQVLRRFGGAAAISGGVFYALFFPAVYAERSTLLEPLGTLAILVALLLLQPRAGSPRTWPAYAAGAVLGLGVAVKIWYVVAVLVVAACQRGGARWRVLLGSAAGAALVCLPFFVAAPRQMTRFVLSDQLGRPLAPVSAVERLESIVGLDPLSRPDSQSSPAIHASLLLMLAIFGTCAVVSALQPGARVFVALLLAHAVVLLASPSYFGHYSTLTATPLALVVGVGVGRLAALSGRPVGAWAATGTALLLVLGYGLSGILHPIGLSFPAAALRPAAARVQGCVISDDPAGMIQLDVLTSDLKRGCQVWPDVTGWLYDRAKAHDRPHHHVSRRRNLVWQRLVRGYLLSGSAVILTRPDSGLSHATLARVKAGPVLAAAGKYTLFATAP